MASDSATSQAERRAELGPPLTEQQREHFARHLSLDEIGEVGQRRLLAARVLVVGAGGLGSPVIAYLAAAGVGTIDVVDDDVIEDSNLQRQVLHSRHSTGSLKVTSAQKRVEELTTYTQVLAHDLRLDASTVESLLRDVDVVIDGSDNFDTRYLVADACERSGLICVWGTLDRVRGQLSTFDAKASNASGISLRDLYPDNPGPDAMPSCAQAGVLGALCGVVGSLMAAEAVKIITGMGEPLIGRLLTVDIAGMEFRKWGIERDPRRLPVTDLTEHTQPRPGEAVTEITAARVRDLRSVDGSSLIPVDVREPAERAAGHVEDDLHLPLDRLLSAESIGDLELTEDTQERLSRAGMIVTYCASGVRSRAAARSLKKLLDEADVRSLSGGFGTWTAAQQSQNSVETQESEERPPEVGK